MRRGRVRWNLDQIYSRNPGVEALRGAISLLP